MTRTAIHVAAVQHTFPSARVILRETHPALWASQEEPRVRVYSGSETPGHYGTLLAEAETIGRAWRAAAQTVTAR